MAETFYTRDVHRLFRTYYPRSTCAQLRVVAEEQDVQYLSGGGGVSHGWMCWQVAVGMGLPIALAEACGDVLDALQPSIDLADNLADVDVDRELGRNPDARYPGVPVEARPFLPALILGACVAEIHRRFPEPDWRPGHAAEQLLGVLARMNQIGRAHV